jgi:hypothetical protein
LPAFRTGEIYAERVGHGATQDEPARLDPGHGGNPLTAIAPGERVDGRGKPGRITEQRRDVAKRIPGLG